MVSTFTMRRTVGLVVVAVALAGCSGVLDGGTSGTTGPASTTDTAGNESLAPGLTEAGVTNASALVATHESALENRSFTRATNTTARAANGSVLVNTTIVTRVGPPGGGIDSVTEQRGSAPSIASSGVPVSREVWSNGSEVFVNSTYANGTSQYDRLPPGSSGRSGAASAGIEFALESYGPANTSVTERQRNGTTRYVVTNDTDGGNSTDSLRLVVDERGLIHELRTGTGSSTSGGATLVRTTEFSAVGATEVPDRPAWVETALNRTDSTGTAATADG